MNEQDWLTSSDPVAMLSLLRHGPNEPSSVIQFAVSDRKLRLFAVACCRAVWHLLTDNVPCGECGGEGGSQTYQGYGNTESESCSNCSGTGRINRSRRAVEVAERFADGLVTEEELRNAGREADRASAPRDLPPATAAIWAASLPLDDLQLRRVLRSTLDAAQVGGFQKVQANLLREIMGNPWKPPLCGVRHGSNWRQCADLVKLRTPTVLSLAQAAYEERVSAECPTCHGSGLVGQANVGGVWRCGTCPVEVPPMKGTGRIDTGHLDPFRVMLVAEAMEEAGCMDEAILRHLRGEEHVHAVLPGGQMSNQPMVWRLLRGPHVRGCWVVDLLLGKDRS